MNIKETPIYREGYTNGYYDGLINAMKALSQPQPTVTNITINVTEKELDKITETDKELEEALNSVKNYRNLLFGGCNDN